jgi:hypothetical protein
MCTTVPGPRYRLIFRSLEYKQLFLDQPFHLRGERVIAQELDMPTLLVKVLYAPSEISNKTIAATLAKYCKIVKVEREMYRDWPNVETGVRLPTMSKLTEGILRPLFIGPYPIETRKYMHAETLALLTKPLYFPNMKYLK